MFRVILIATFLLSGCTTTGIYVHPDSNSALARVIPAKPKFLETDFWSGSIGFVADSENNIVIGMARVTGKNRREYRYVDLSSGEYRVEMDCYSPVEHTYHMIRVASILIKVEAGNEYVLGCRPYVSEQRDHQGFKIKKMKLELLNENEASE